ncbi:MAG: NUDIX domain-containing protein, partial [Lentisphaeraceae bacterium]|nr:NUDIX domain-containing protein [Lentisphaeraceae bacterium]
CNSKESAVRELEEELGIHASEEELLFLFEHVDPYEDKRTGHVDREFSEVYLLKVDSSIEFNLDNDEVDEVRWIPYKQLIPEYESKPEEFVPHTRHFKKLVSAIEKLDSN